jgi:hypothetical protein
MLMGACKVRAMIKEHKDSNCRGLEAWTMEGNNSITATQKDVLHSNSGTSSGVTLLVVVVQLGFGLLEVHKKVRIIQIVGEHFFMRYCESQCRINCHYTALVSPFRIVSRPVTTTKFLWTGRRRHTPVEFFISAILAGKTLL